MRWLLLPVSLLAAAVAFFAQTAPPNPAGVSFGHIHIMTPDPVAYQKTIISVLGGTAVNDGPLNMVKLPGIFVIAMKPQGAGPSGGSKGSTADHMGFSVKSYAATKAKAEAAGLKVQELTPNVQAFVTFPNDVIVEIQEDTALTTESAFSHFHLSVPDPNAAREWYIKTFGATEGQRRPGQKGAVIPNGFVDFLSSAGRGGGRGGKDGAPPPPPPAPPAGTMGRYLDHVGFEVKDLDAFIKKLQADGVKIDSGPTDMTKQIGLKIAFITDPFGTRIELTEGLSKQ